MAKKKKVVGYTEIVVVLDRSGSMEECKIEAQNGLNHFVDVQKEEKGKCLFTLVQFDTEYEFVHKGTHILDVEKFELIPRGMTALLDAVGRAINETSVRIDELKKKDKPSLVIVVIITDGYENSSHEFSLDQIKELIKKKQDDAWQFTFLGANQDAFAAGMGMGIIPSGCATYSTQKTAHAFSGMASNVSRMRVASIRGTEIKNAYTNAELEAME